MLPPGMNACRGGMDRLTRPTAGSPRRGTGENGGGGVTRTARHLLVQRGHHSKGATMEALSRGGVPQRSLRVLRRPGRSAVHHTLFGLHPGVRGLD